MIPVLTRISTNFSLNSVAQAAQKSPSLDLCIWYIFTPYYVVPQRFYLQNYVCFTDIAPLLAGALGR